MNCRRHRSSPAFARSLSDISLKPDSASRATHAHKKLSATCNASKNAADGAACSRGCALNSPNAGGNVSPTVKTLNKAMVARSEPESSGLRRAAGRRGKPAAGPATRPQDQDFRILSASSPGLKIPFSVMMPVISLAGVTSKAGFTTSTPSGAIASLPRTCVTSRGLRCSIGI